MAEEADFYLSPAITGGVAAGSRQAIEKARRAGTPLVIWRNGKIQHITPDEAETLIKERTEQPE